MCIAARAWTLSSIDGSKKTIASLATGLGLIHCQIGSSQQRGRACPIVRKERDADRRAHLDHGIFQLNRAGNDDAEQLGNARGMAAIVRRGEHYRKFVSAKPGDRSQFIAVGNETLRELAQHEVAGIMPIDIVHWFEAVQIDHHYGCGMLCVRSDAPKNFRKEAPIGQTGQRVVPRQSLGAGLGLQGPLMLRLDQPSLGAEHIQRPHHRADLVTPLAANQHDVGFARRQCRQRLGNVDQRSHHPAVNKDLNQEAGQETNGRKRQYKHRDEVRHPGRHLPGSIGIGTKLAGQKIRLPVKIEVFLL